MKFRHPGCIKFLSILVIIAMTLMLIEYVLLRTFDPLGIYTYAANLQALFSLSVPAEHGLTFEPGDYQLPGFHVTINEDGFRAVPESRTLPCRIAFIGDSVTFGFGSDVSFVNLLAPDIPAAVINAGIPGYNIGNIVKMPGLVPADGYVYLIIENDGGEPAGYWRTTPDVPSPAWVLYLEWHVSSDIDLAAFRRQASDLLAREDVLAFAFKGRGMTDVIQREFSQVKIIEMYPQSISWADGHPSEKGAAEIADSMRDAVVAFARQRCNQP